MRTIGITIKRKLYKGQIYPYFVRGKNPDTWEYFWMVKEPVLITGKNRKTEESKTHVKAVFLGNSSYHPFQYESEIRLNQYKRVKTEAIVMKFE